MTALQGADPANVLLVLTSCPRYLDRAGDSDNPLRRRYTDYESMRMDVLGKKDDVEFKAPITICDIYGPRTQDVLDAIHSVAVSGLPVGRDGWEGTLLLVLHAQRPLQLAHLQSGWGVNSAHCSLHACLLCARLLPCLCSR